MHLGKTSTDLLQYRRWRLASLVTLGVCITVALTTALQLLLVEHFANNYARKEAELQLQQL